MEWELLFVHAVAGLIFGSFLNVVVLRYHTGKSITGRSACSSCGNILRWWELVPVFSWLFLRGRCASCGSPISWQYPAVELVSALLFVVIAGAGLPLPLHIAALITALILLAIAVYDMHHTIIPDLWVYTFAGISLAVAVLFHPWGTSSFAWLALLASGPIVAAPLALLWLVSSGRWMGLGDAKLMLGAGWLLGLGGGLIALLCGFVLGAVVSVFILLPLPHIQRAIHRTGIHSLSGRSQRFTMKSEIPFGPFLITSIFFVWFTQMYDIPLTALLYVVLP